MEHQLAFSNSKREEIISKLTNHEFDLVFTSCNIAEALSLLIASKEGLSCALVCSNDFKVGCFPILEKKDRNEAIIFLQKQLPHLFLETEFLNLDIPVKTIRQVFTSGIKNIKNKDAHLYEPLVVDNTFKSIFLSKEIKLNPQRILIEILKHAVAEGATVINNLDTYNHEGLRIQENKKEIKAKHIIKLNWKSSDKKTTELKLDQEPLGLKRNTQLYSNNSVIRIIKGQKESLAIIEEKPFDPKSFLLEAINEKFETDGRFSMINCKSPSEETYPKNSALNLQIRKSFALLKQKLNLSEKISLSILFSSEFSNELLVGKTQIHELIEYCDCRYNEAKQTNISNIDFKILFYRYGSDIEILTEKAYELKSKYPDGKELWNEVENWYLENYELLQSSANKAIRFGFE